MSNYKDIFEKMIDGALILNKDGKILESNQSCRKLMQCSHKDLRDSCFSDYLLPEDVDCFMGCLKNALYNNNSSFEASLQQKNTNCIVVQGCMENIGNEQVFLLLRSVDSQKTASDSVLLGTLKNNFPGYICIVDSHGTILEINRTCKDAEPTLIAGQKVDTYFESFYKKIWLGALNTAFIKQKSTSFESSVSINNNKLYFSNTLSPVVFNNQVNCAVLISIDITKKKQTEKRVESHQKQLIQAAKMASLGILVSGVAHEINNPTSFILLNAQYFSKAWEDIACVLEEHYKTNGDFSLAGMPYSKGKDCIPELVSSILKGTLRIKKIVEGLREFIYQDDGNMNQKVDINDVIEKAVMIVGNLIKKNTHHFTLELDKTIPRIYGNFQQLEQVVINLITNACQALENMSQKCKVISYHEKTANSVVLKVIDEGKGIPEENLQKIMDPFFTTKLQNSGTGLGLSISYNIIRNHKGLIEFFSQIGKGTTVKITLPIERITKTR